MIKRALLAAAALGAVAAVPASAVTIIATAGEFAAPSAGLGYSFDFNGGSDVAAAADFASAGFTVSTVGFAGVRNGTLNGQFVAPNPGDNSPFYSVQANSQIDIYRAGTGFDSISLYVGTLDGYNSITLLDIAGQEISGQTYDGASLISPLTPDNLTSYRITFNREAGDVQIGGLRIMSSGNAAEFDNLVFAVPEPSTWALMLAGFGMVGMAMRTRRRRTNVVFA